MIAIYFFIAWILAILQYSVLTFWPVLQYISPLLLVALFVTVAHKHSQSIFIVLWCGLILDWYSSTPLGFNVFIFGIIWLIVIFTMRRFFTNLSLLSGLSMMVISVTIFRFLTWLLVLILNALNIIPVRIIINSGWLIFGLWMVAVNCLLFMIIFIGANRISKIFNFAFINKR